MKHCPKCNLPCSDTAKFCINGHRLELSDNDIIDFLQGVIKGKDDGAKRVQD
jgi:hypothetical protein